MNTTRSGSTASIRCRKSFSTTGHESGSARSTATWCVVSVPPRREMSTTSAFSNGIVAASAAPSPAEAPEIQTMIRRNGIICDSALPAGKLPASCSSPLQSQRSPCPATPLPNSPPLPQKSTTQIAQNEPLSAFLTMSNQTVAPSALSSNLGSADSAANTQRLLSLRTLRTVNSQPHLAIYLL